MYKMISQYMNETPIVGVSKKDYEGIGISLQQGAADN